jgi:diguanylate cyclase (GGDEF)-like protein
MANLREWLSPPEFPGDEEFQLRARLLNLISWIVLVYLAVIIPANMLSRTLTPAVHAINFSVFVICIGLRLALWRGRLLWVAAVYIVLGFLWATMVSISLGTVRTPTTAVFLLLVVMSGAYFYWKGVGISTLVSSLIVLGLILAENAGLLPQPDFRTTYIQWITYTCLFGATGSLSYYFSQSLKNALKRAESEIERREQVEMELRVTVAEVVQLHEELREQSLRDPLTGLYNRRYLNETLEHEIERARRDNRPLSVIISDLDDFKKINDGYGHQAGDMYLKEIAELMKKSARDSDFVCRYGGEEFLLVLPGVSVNDAVSRSNELRQRVLDLVFQYKGDHLKTTLSFGVASFPEHGQDPEEIVIKADQALYYSKHAGRNRVTVWGDM